MPHVFAASEGSWEFDFYLVRDSLSIRSPLGNSPEGCRASSNSRTGEAEGVHDELRGVVEMLLKRELKYGRWR
jgi:hypothetical protein